MISDTRFRMKYSPKGKQIPQENLTVLDDLKEEVAALKRQVVLMTKSIKQRFRRKKRPVQPSNSSHVIEVSHLTDQKKGDDNTRQHHPNKQTSPIARTAIIPMESKHEVNQSLKPPPPPRPETIRRWRCWKWEHPPATRKVDACLLVFEQVREKIPVFRSQLNTSYCGRILSNSTSKMTVPRVEPSPFANRVWLKTVV